MDAENKKVHPWIDGIMGAVVGDALGCPVQFETREEVSTHPVTGMRGSGAFSVPAGTWTDDSSLTLALLESIRRCGQVDPDDIMKNFMKWLYDGAFTPFGKAFDIGRGTMQAIHRYRRNGKWKTCGGMEEENNGNGSLMRILPVCIYGSILRAQGKLTEKQAVETVHQVGGLTHAHIRSNIACGLYFFMTDEILTQEGTLKTRLQNGLARGFAFYEGYLADRENLHYYDRLRDLDAFGELPENRIRSSGYVVDTLEAVIWSLIRTASLEQALLTAVNLGDDTDTVGAIAGGLAGLYYGIDAVPKEWLCEIQRREWIEELCEGVL